MLTTIRTFWDHCASVVNQVQLFQAYFMPLKNHMAQTVVDIEQFIEKVPASIK